jgi:uncharacterized protein YndB with AHSA1/START domain
MSDGMLHFVQAVKAPAGEVYRAFTKATALREWMSDVATVDPRPGGRIYLYWNSGYYTAGEFLRTEPGEFIEFTWNGRNEPGRTRVTVSLETMDSGTLVNLDHADLGQGGDWQQPAREYRQGWQESLENLASVLETGRDLRLIRRPMLGIMLSDYNAEIAGQLGIPVMEGVRIDSTMEGMGARRAGLQLNDVIVGLDGQPIIHFASLAAVVQKHKAGDKIEVAFYRGPEKHTATMELSGRPIPGIPFDPKELAAARRKLNDELNAEIKEIFDDVTEKEASYYPAPGEWSAKDNLAHLILSERYQTMAIADLVVGYERWSDEGGVNVHEQTRALVTAYPTVGDLLEEYRRNQAETLALIEALPAEFIQHKGSYWRMAYSVLEDNTHPRSHFQPIRAAIKAARGNL